MGACYTKDVVNGGQGGGGRYVKGLKNEEKGFEEDDTEMQAGDGCSRVILEGCSSFTAMYSQQGRKGINQDAITVWEVARHVRNNLPLKLSKAMKLFPLKHLHLSDGNGSNPFFSSCEAILEQSFKELDEELGLDSTIDCFCSGTTAVSVIKHGSRLIIANLGDSRAVLGTRGNKNKLGALQLTVDLKPDIPSEAERIKNCKGRIFSVSEEPDVYRVWMPDEDCPGLAMARAFGDFCLKDYGLSSIPQVSYRTLTDDDEFVVLATDGIWDVLSNAEVVRIVASAKKRSKAAKLLVSRAVGAWKSNYPGSKIDDCGVVCLFLKNPVLSIDSTADRKAAEVVSISCNRNEKGGVERVSGGGDGGEQKWRDLEGFSRVNTLSSLPRLARALSRR